MKRSIPIRKNLYKIIHSECEKYKIAMQFSFDKFKENYEDKSKLSKNCDNEDDINYPKVLECEPINEEEKELERAKLIVTKKLFRNPAEREARIPKRKAVSQERKYHLFNYCLEKIF